MSMRAWVAAMMVAGLGVVGCQRKQPPAVAKPVPVPVNAETREFLAKQAPNAKIGRVVEVLEEQRLASVADLPVQDFLKGDVLTFFGGEEEPLTSGVVVMILPDRLHVQYAAPAEGKRAPAPGDLVIRFK